jgi:hypothetical protein
MDIDRAAYLDCVKYHEREGMLLDRTLYQLCAEHPRHDTIGAVNAKLWLIGRGFATGIERHVRSFGTQGSSLGRVAEHLLRHRVEVDEIVQQLRELAEPIDVETLSKVVALHGQFCKLVSRIANGKKVLVSFASKYLHFHAPLVPIFDTWVYGQAWRMRQKATLVSFSPPKGAASPFYWYCLCLVVSYQGCRSGSCFLR